MGDLDSHKGTGEFQPHILQATRIIRQPLQLMCFFIQLIIILLVVIYFIWFNWSPSKFFIDYILIVNKFSTLYQNNWKY